MAEPFCMMNKLIIILTLGLSGFAYGQTEDTIEYFTDSDISDTRFSIAGIYAPSFSSRRLALYEPQTDGNEIYALNSEDATGVLSQRYGIIAYYELRNIFHLGIGFITDQSGYVTDGFEVFNQNAAVQPSSIGSYAARTDIQAITVPVQIIFHTQMTDSWALQVIPSYDLTFYQKIDRTWIGDDALIQGLDFQNDDVTGALGTMYQRGSSIKYHKGFNGTIGFALGNEFTIANNLVLTARGEFRLAALPINKEDIGLSEVPYSLGGAVGFRYYL
ncbi:hypothetical protein OAQ85_01285 [Schleiferiaceae bacterium]|nr:hypothetical protein [Schleiferiaceae bacterium]